MYIFADSPAEAAALSANQISSTLDVSEKSRFIYWSGDVLAHSRVHFCSDMTLSGLDEGETFTQGEIPVRYLRPIMESTDAPVGLHAQLGSMRFSVQVLLVTKAHVRAASEHNAKECLAQWTSTSAGVSIDDPRWLHHSPDDTHSLRLSPRTTVVKYLGAPVEITKDNDEEDAVVDAVVADILSPRNRDRRLLKRLLSQAKRMRKSGVGNHGWMSDKDLVETMLRTVATERYRHLKK